MKILHSIIKFLLTASKLKSIIPLDPFKYQAYDILKVIIKLGRNDQFCLCYINKNLPPSANLPGAAESSSTDLFSKPREALKRSSC